MSLLLALLAVDGLTTLVRGAPLPQTPSLDKRNAVQYIQYTGTGASPNWPAQSSWLSFDELFAGSVNIIKGSCTQFGAANPSDSEVSDLKSAINTVAGESGIPASYIFAIMMQESNGCVRAPTTNYGVRNPGLMQDHDGQASCNDGSQINPCPLSTITQMIRDGVEGTPAGDGLKQVIAQTGDSSVSRFYKAARMYNSGSIAASGQLQDGIATHCYASDIANRLVGWSTAPHNCNLDGAAVQVTTPGSAPATTPSSTPVVTPTPTPQAPKPSPTKSKKPKKPHHKTTSAPKPTKSAPGGLSSGNAGGVFGENGHASNGAKPAALTPKPFKAAPKPKPASSSTPVSSEPLGPGVSTSCPKLHPVAAGDNCYSLGLQFGFTFAQFQQWNPLIDAQCSNLWLGYQYCVGS